MHQPRPNVGLEHQREVVGEYLVVSSPGSLHRDGVDAQELGRVSFTVIFLRDFWFERSGIGPLESPQLTSKRWSPYLIRQVTRIPWRRLIYSGPRASVGLTTRFP